MASKLVKMKSIKKHQLSKIESELNYQLAVECVGRELKELSGVKILMLVYEKYYVRNDSYAALTILITEYQDEQRVELISAGGKNTFFSFGAEGNFVSKAESILRRLDFSWDYEKIVK